MVHQSHKTYWLEIEIKCIIWISSSGLHSLSMDFLIIEVFYEKFLRITFDVISFTTVALAKRFFWGICLIPHRRVSVKRILCHIIICLWSRREVPVAFMCWYPSNIIRKEAYTNKVWTPVVRRRTQIVGPKICSDAIGVLFQNSLVLFSKKVIIYWPNVVFVPSLWKLGTL